jgi:hypothetical protein
MSLLLPCNSIWDGTLCFEIYQLCPSLLSNDVSKTLAGQGPTHMLAMFTCACMCVCVCACVCVLSFSFLPGTDRAVISLHMQSAHVYVLEGSQALRTYMLAFRRHKIRYTHIQDSHMAREGHPKQMQRTAMYF